MNPSESRRIEKRRHSEIKALETMIDLYEKKHPGQEDYPMLREVVRKRFQACPHMEKKTFCSRCPNHCFASQPQIRIIMKESGMEMMKSHPVLALRHLLTDLGL